MILKIKILKPMNNTGKYWWSRIGMKEMERTMMIKIMEMMMIMGVMEKRGWDLEGKKVGRKSKRKSKRKKKKKKKKKKNLKIIWRKRTSLRKHRWKCSKMLNKIFMMVLKILSYRLVNFDIFNSYKSIAFFQFIQYIYILINL